MTRDVMFGCSRAYFSRFRSREFVRAHFLRARPDSSIFSGCSRFRSRDFEKRAIEIVSSQKKAGRAGIPARPLFSSKLRSGENVAKS